MHCLHLNLVLNIYVLYINKWGNVFLKKIYTILLAHMHCYMRVYTYFKANVF